MNAEYITSPTRLYELTTIKVQIERRRQSPLIHPGLCTIDGVDGAGKTMMAETLRQSLGLADLKNQPMVVSINTWLAQNQRLSSALQAAEKIQDKEKIQNVYHAAWSSLMFAVESHLRNGWMVIMDSSPIRTLVIHEGGDPRLLARAKERWEDGTVTHYLYPGVALFLKTDDTIIHGRLELREKNQIKKSYDPLSLQEIEIKQKSYLEAYGRYQKIDGIRCIELDSGKATRDFLI